MKKINSILKTFFIVSALSSVFFSCSDFEQESLSSSSGKKAYITINASIDGLLSKERSLNPSADDTSVEKMTNFALYCTTEEAFSGTPKATAESYNKLSSINLELTEGTWSFKLTAELNGISFESILNNQQLSAGANSLTFTLTPVDTNLGGMEITVYYKGEADLVKAQLGGTDKPKEELTSTNLDNGMHSVTYSKKQDALIAQGQYSINIYFYANGIEEPLNTYTDIVNVYGGIITTASNGNNNPVILNKAYTITYVYNYEGAPEEAPEGAQVKYSRKTNVTLPQAITRDNYVFKGWYYNEDGTGDPVASWNANTKTGNVTLYAKWEAADASYTVRHWMQKLGSGTDPENDYNIGNTKTYYGHAGEQTNAATGANIYPGFTPQTIEEQIINADNSTVVDVYYNRDTYKVTYKPGADDASIKNIPTDETEYQYEATVNVIFDPEVTRNDYKFTGWRCENKNETYTQNGASFTMSEGGVELIAQWEINTYTVTFNYDDGTTDNSSQMYEAGKIVDHPPTDLLTKTGYTAGDWYIVGTDGTLSEEAFDFTQPIHQDYNLKLKWEPVEYTIAYENVEGATYTPAATSYTIENPTFALTEPNRRGYKFEGWYDAETDGNIVTEIAQGTTGNITLYARWSGASVGGNITITFAGQESDISITQSEEVIGAVTYKVLTAAAGFENYQWTFDDDTPNAYEPEGTCTIDGDNPNILKINTANLASGAYVIFVTAQKDGESYSACMTLRK